MVSVHLEEGTFRPLRDATAALFYLSLTAFVIYAILLARAARERASYELNLSHAAAMALSAKFDHVTSDVDALADAVNNPKTGLKRSVQNLLANSAAVMKVASQDLAQQRSAWDAEQRYLESVTTKTSALLDSAKTSVEDLQPLEQAMTTTIATLGTDAHDTLAAATSDLRAPQLQDTLTNLDASSRSLAAASSDAAATMADVRAGVHAEVRTLTAPVSKLKVVALFLIKAAGKFFGY